MARRSAQSRRGFTVLELMVTVVIITIIISLSSVGYARYKDRAAMLVDETNQKVLMAAVKLYAYDTNALPGSLSQLRDNDLQRAYALVTDGKRPYTFLAFLQENVGLFDIAEAAPLPSRYLGDNPQRILTCPLDGTPPATGGVSYGIHQDVANKPLSWLLDPANAGQVCIGESDVSVASDSDFVRRHDGGKTFVEISTGGIVKRDMIKRGSNNTPAQNITAPSLTSDGNVFSGG